MKYIKLLSFFLLALAMNTAMAGSFSKFSTANGNLKKDAADLHTTYFVTKSSEPVSTHVTLKIGHWQNNTCKPLLSESDNQDISSNSTLSICADCLKKVLGGGFTCGIEEYKNNKTGKFTSISYQIIWDGKNYIGAMPSEHTVTLD